MTLLTLANQVPPPPLNGKEPCATGDPERYHPQNGNCVATLEVLAACRKCRVVEQCLAYALANDVHGIWGGTSRRERDRWRKEHRVTPRPVAISDYFLDSEAVLRMRARGTSVGQIAKILKIPDASVTRILRRDLDRQQEAS